MRDESDKHAWWKMWEDVTTNRNMRRWIHDHGHWIGWAWIACQKLANDPDKDGRLCNRKSGQQYEAFDVSDEASVTIEQASTALDLFLLAEWMHRDPDGCLVVTRFYDRNVPPGTQRVRKHRETKRYEDVTTGVTNDVTCNVTGNGGCNAQRTEDRGQRSEGRKQTTEATPKPPSKGDVSVSKPKRKQSTGPAEPIAVPDWMPLDEWTAFDKMRRNGGKRKDWSRQAMTMIVNKLDKMRTKGVDVAAVLSESVMNGWTGVFEPKGNGGGRSRVPVADDYSSVKRLREIEREQERAGQ